MFPGYRWCLSKASSAPVPFSSGPSLQPPTPLHARHSELQHRCHSLSRGQRLWHPNAHVACPKSCWQGRSVTSALVCAVWGLGTLGRTWDDGREVCEDCAFLP